MNESSTPKLDHIPSLDGVRGLAALLVIWAHLPQVGDSWFAHKFKVLAGYAHANYLGVDIFFVLSGFLITRILLSAQQAGAPLRQFYIRRTLRIFPIYYLVVLDVAVFSKYDVTWAATYLFNFRAAFYPAIHPLEHTWSLDVEEHFYLFWPLIIYGHSRIVSQRLALIVIPGLSLAATILSAILFDGSVANALISGGTFSRMLSLSMGAGLAFHEATIRDMKRKYVEIIAIGAMVIGASIVAIPDHFAIGILPAWKPLPLWVGGAMVSAGFVTCGIRARPVGGGGGSIGCDGHPYASWGVLATAYTYIIS